MERASQSTLLTACLWMSLAAVAVASQLCLSQYILLDWPVTLLLIMRFAVEAIALWLLCVVVHRIVWPFFLSHFLLWRVFFLVLAQVLVLIYVMHAALMDATLLYLASPLWTPFLSWLFFRESCNRFHLISLVLGFIGVACMLHIGASIWSVFVPIGVLSGLANACGQVMAHRLSHERPALLIMTNTFVYGAVVILLLAWLVHSTHPAWVPVQLSMVASPHLWWLFLLVFVSLFIMGGRLKAYALVAQPAYVMPFIFLAVPCAALFDWLLYQRLPGMYELFGALFIVGACIIAIFAKRLMGDCGLPKR